MLGERNNDTFLRRRFVAIANEVIASIADAHPGTEFDHVVPLTSELEDLSAQLGCRNPPFRMLTLARISDRRHEDVIEFFDPYSSSSRNQLLRTYYATPFQGGVSELYNISEFLPSPDNRDYLVRLLRRWIRYVENPELSGRVMSGGVQEMRREIPQAVIATAGDVIGQWCGSHTRIDTLFMEAGAPGAPPGGNKVSKCQTWLMRTNSAQDLDPMHVLEQIIAPFVATDDQSEPTRHGQDRLRRALAACGLELAPDGRILDAHGVLTPVSEAPSLSDVPPAASARSPHAHITAPPAKVFIVHGRNDGLKNTVARFLTALGIEPIILHEQKDFGRTLIEKFEENAEATYAVALCTADDKGCAAKDYSCTPADQLVSRPRQNVVFEFGYFLGSLGRERACAIVEPGVEMPSDYAGVVYVALANWQGDLLRRLTDAGFDFDQRQATSALAIR